VGIPGDLQSFAGAKHGFLYLGDGCYRQSVCYPKLSNQPAGERKASDKVLATLPESFLFPTY
jgi:hypothetical protein